MLKSKYAGQAYRSDKTIKDSSPIVNFPNSNLNDPHTSDAGCFASDGELERLAELDVRGDGGRNGRDGQSFRHPPRSAGTAGRRGGDATAAERGEDAAKVALVLDYDNGDRDSGCLLYTSPSPRDLSTSRMPSSA